MAKLILGSEIANYIRDLEKLEADSQEVIGRAIYEGAAIVTDEIKKEISALPVYTKKPKSGEMMTGITSTQKAGLLEGLGIAKLRNDSGLINVKVGFDGYNRTRTEKYPKGQPNAVIARSLASGTSFRTKNDFISRAFRRSKDRAERAMEDELNKQIEERMARQ